MDSTRVAFFNAHAPYQTSHPAGFHDRGGFFVIRTDVIDEIIRGHDAGRRGDPEGVFRLQQGPISGKTYLRHRLLLQKFKGDLPIDALECEEEALDLADQVVAEIYGDPAKKFPHARRTSSRCEEAVAGAKQFLAKRFIEVRRLSDIAHAVGLSPYHLCRVFKSETGCTIHTYLNRLRLRAALDQLQDHAKDLLTLALETGFSSHSHFTQAFRREFGVLPSILAGDRALLP